MSFPITSFDAASMESSILKLKLLSCNNLKAFNFFQKLSVYAIVSLYSDEPNKKLENSQEQKTRADEEGDGNPEWNHDMEFDLSKFTVHDYDRLFLKVEMKHSVFLFGDNHIGEVRIPVRDLIQQPDGVVRFMSYEVRGADKRPNGVLSFSCQVMVKGKFIYGEADSPINHDQNQPAIHYEGHYESVQQFLYPKLDIGEIYPQTCSNHASSSSYYPPSPQFFFPAPSHIYPPPPEQPLNPPPPPPPMISDGGHYSPHGRPSLYPWDSMQYSTLYGYGFRGNQGTVFAHHHYSIFGNGER